MCSDFYEKIQRILLRLGFNADIIKTEQQICNYLSKTDRMNYYAAVIYNRNRYDNIGKNVHIGEFTYGSFSIMDYEEGVHLSIGKITK